MTRLLFGILCGITASWATADDRPVSVPIQFVCSIAGSYVISDSGVMESASQKVSGSVLTVDTQRGAVAGDAISAAQFSWSVVPPSDKRNAVKLLGTSPSGTAMVSVLVYKPQRRDNDTFYPFTFFDANAGQVFSGTCRGAR